MYLNVFYCSILLNTRKWYWFNKHYDQPRVWKHKTTKCFLIAEIVWKFSKKKVQESWVCWSSTRNSKSLCVNVFPSFLWLPSAVIKKFYQQKCICGKNVKGQGHSDKMVWNIHYTDMAYPGNLLEVTATIDL